VDEADEANGMSPKRLKLWNCGMKCVKIWNDKSVNRMDLSETNGEIANGNHVRRSNGRNEKDLEIESGSCGAMRTIETKQIQWTDECDNRRDRGCVENLIEKVKCVRGEKDMIEEYFGMFGVVLIPVLISGIDV